MLTNPITLHTMEQLNPEKLSSHGFSFRYAKIRDAVRAVVEEGSDQQL